MQQHIPRVLVVDDEIQNRKFLFEFLRSRYYDVLQTVDGKEGCMVAEKERPDLIIMDWVMPVMNGIDAVLTLKARQATKDIPVLMATGLMTSSEDLKEAMTAGAIDFVRKPFDAVELESRIGTALRLHQSFQEIKQQKQTIEQLRDQERRLLEGELEQKKRELALQALHANEKDAFLDEVIDDLKKLKKEPTEKGIQAVLKEIKKRRDSEKSWDSFMHHFENVHPHFFKQLKISFPGLSNNDLKLCAYLKIGLSNKEIASLAGVGDVSVKSSLYRLKKKLDMGPDDSLRNYMIRFG